MNPADAPVTTAPRRLGARTTSPKPANGIPAIIPVREQPDLDVEFSRLGLGYRMHLPLLRTTFDVTGLKRSGGDLMCDLTIKTEWPGARTYNGILFMARYNITAVTSRSTTGKYIVARVPSAPADELDWTGYLERLCHHVMTSERQGEPVRDVGAQPIEVETVPLIYPLLPAGKATVLFGDGGTGKSYMAVAMAVSVKTGREVIPGLHPNVMGEVLYLDWETDADDMNMRIRNVCAGLDIEPVNIRYRSCSRVLSDIVESVMVEVAARDVVLVVIDSAALAMGGAAHESADPADAVVRFYSALREVGVTTLIIDHVAKSGTSGKPYGSTYKHNLARATWELRQSKTTDEQVAHLGLFHRKHNTSRKYDAMGYSMEWDEEGRSVRWFREELNEGDLTEGLTNAERIRMALLEHPKRTKEIAEELDISEVVCRVELNRGRKAGRFIRLDTSDWAVAAAEGDSA